MPDKTIDIRDAVAEHRPLVHCITNPISINQCANAVLAIGARPVMAEHPGEVAEITRSADALLLNMGNITDARMESIMISLREASSKGIPVVLDVVGIAASKLRRSYVYGLLEAVVPSVIKGNYSEIAALWDKDYSYLGVDGDAALDSGYIDGIVSGLCAAYHTVVIATGQTDIVSDARSTVYVRNGTPQLASVTGTGCMLGALCTAFMTVAQPTDAAVASCCYLGICGELAKTEKGSGSFMLNLMDNLSVLKNEDIAGRIKAEVKEK